MFMCEGPSFSLISFPEALGRLLSRVRPAAVERVALAGAAGRVLRGELHADRDFPPYDRVMMDGFALRSDDLAVCRSFRVCGVAPAGRAAVVLPESPGCCVEVMTGAPCPQGADCVVPVEKTVRAGDVVEVAAGFQPPAGGYLHRTGSDAGAGELLLRSGRRLGGVETGVAASCGAAWLEVSALPSIAVCATGDELAPVDSTPAVHQVRQSNAHALSASLSRAGFPPARTECVGDGAEGRARLAGLLAEHDWLLLTGAVSMGARDFVPGLLAGLGCRLLFHGVAQRPGKPAGCWLGPDGQMVLGLPGNPVSALTGLHVFGLPALNRAACLTDEQPLLVVPAEGVRPLPDMSWHLPVWLDAAGMARPAPPGNSGDFIGLLRGNGFVTLPPGAVAPQALLFTPWL